MFWKQVEGAVKARYFLLLPLFIAILGVTTTLPSLRDQTHEIERVGSAWINDGAILYAQKWSHYSPQTLAIGAVYNRYINDDFSRIAFEAVFIIAVATLTYLLVNMLNDNPIRNRVVLLLGSSALLIPGAWQIGITPSKLSLVFLCSAYLSFLKWHRSGKSYWFFGETSKNWRYLLLCGVSISSLLFTSLYFFFFAIPLFVMFFRTIHSQKLSLIRQSGFIIIPLLIELWVWYSVLSPRKLINDYIQASIIDFRILTTDTTFLLNSWPILLATLLISSLAIAGVHSKNIKKNPLIWWISIVVIVSLIFMPSAAIQAVLIIIILSSALYTTESARIVRPAFLIFASFLLLGISLPLRTTLQKELLLDRTEAELAASYVEQRLVDSRFVYYYGSSAGFYAFSQFTNPTRFYDARIFSYDNENVNFIDKFRGDNEAERPLFIVYATGERTVAPVTPRLEEYFQRHYEEVASISGYRILKRQSNF